MSQEMEVFVCFNFACLKYLFQKDPLQAVSSSLLFLVPTIGIFEGHTEGIQLQQVLFCVWVISARFQIISL
jgi:hypothetical protein